MAGKRTLPPTVCTKMCLPYRKKNIAFCNVCLQSTDLHQGKREGYLRSSVKKKTNKTKTKKKKTKWIESKNCPCSIQADAQNRRELVGTDWSIDQLAFALPPTGDTKHGSGQDVRRAAKLVGAGRRRGEFNQSWPSARQLVTPKVLCPRISLEGCTWRGKMHFLCDAGCHIE